MELITVLTPVEYTALSGVQELVLAAGTRILVKTNNPDNTLLDVRVPHGKQWTTVITVGVREIPAPPPSIPE